jgi:hypothetical protein
VQLDITKPFLCIGRLGANYLLIQPTHRAYRVTTAAHNGKPPSEDNSGNWLHTKIDITASSFRGTYATHLHISDFVRFRDELIELNAVVSRRETTNRTAAFRSPHGTLRLTIEANLAEYYTVTCEASDGAGSNALLLFALKFDRSEMPDIVRNLNLMLAQFPLNTEAGV